MAGRRNDGDAFKRLETLGDSRRPRASSDEGAALQRLSELGRKGKGSGKRPSLGGLKGRMRKGVAVFASVVLIAAALGGGYLFYRWGQIDKLDLSGVLEGGNGRAMTVLVVGSDTRKDLEGGQSKQFGTGKAVAGQRSDTIMLLRIDPANERAAILSLPRDLYVTIAGTGGKNRINTAFEQGPETLIRTIRNNFNIPIDHYAQVNFDTFRGVVDAIGGVKVPFDTPVRDYDPGVGRNISGLNIAKAGCVTLDGDQALSYVRSRHYQIFKNGRWQSDPLSDLGRIQRQQDFVRRVAAESVSDAKTDPRAFNGLVKSAVENVTVDKDLSIVDMTRLANRFKSLDPGSIQTFTMPSEADTVGGASVLIPDRRATPKMVEEFLNGPPEPEKPAGDQPEAPAATTTTEPRDFVPEEGPTTC